MLRLLFGLLKRVVRYFAGILDFCIVSITTLYFIKTLSIPVDIWIQKIPLNC
jgi:hypothetical protein